MAVYLAWTSQGPDESTGPWTEMRTIAPGLLALDSTESLSVVYHALKWSLPPDAGLLVTPLAAMPKSRGMAPGTTAWLRDRMS